MKTYLLSLITLVALNATVKAQTLGYLTPRKTLVISVPYTIDQVKKVDANGKQIGVAALTVTIDADVTVQEVMTLDSYKAIDLSKLGKGGRSFDFELTFDPVGNGTLNGLNGSQVPVTSQIISGVVSIAGSIISAALPLLKGMAPADIAKLAKADTAKLTEVKTEQKIIEKRIINITDDTQTIEIKPAILNAPTIPFVKVILTKQADPTGISPATGKPGDPPNNQQSDDNYSLVYNIPALYELNVQVVNNNLCSLQNIIDQYIYVPQKGYPVSLPVPILKGNRSVVLGFSATTGNLTQYSFKKTSQVSDVLTQTKTSVDDLTKAVSDYKAATKDTSLQNSVDKLTLQNQLLQLQITQKQLQTQVTTP